MDIVNELEREWHAFKAANDERLAEIERYGQATAETSAKVDRINSALSELQGKLDEQHAAQGQRLDEIENRLNRPGAGAGRIGRVSDEDLVVYAAWQGAVQGCEIDPGAVDLELVAHYTIAFRDYVRHGARADAKHLQVLNELSVGSDADGGYWVSPDLSGMVATLVRETSPIRQHASVQEISTDALEGDLDLDEAGTGGWVGENATRSGDTSTPTIGTWRIPVHEQYAEPRATQKLLDDARVNVEAWLGNKVADRFARDENSAFVTGDGVTRPRGFTTYTAGTPTASAWDRIEQIVSGSASALTPDGLVDLVFALKSVYRPGSIFGMTRTTEREVRQLKDGQSNYLWQPDFTQTSTARLLGFPVVEMPDLAEIAANALPIVFGNLKRVYQVVDRGGLRVLRDPYTIKGKVKFYSTKRVGGGVVNFEAIKLQKVSA